MLCEYKKECVLKKKKFETETCPESASAEYKRLKKRAKKTGNRKTAAG